MSAHPVYIVWNWRKQQAGNTGILERHRSAKPHLSVSAAWLHIIIQDTWVGPIKVKLPSKKKHGGTSSIPWKQFVILWDQIRIDLNFDWNFCFFKNIAACKKTILN